MGRKPTLRYTLKSNLGSYQSYGRSKFFDKKNTYIEREKCKRELIENGMDRTEAHQESYKINFMKEHIYSYQTMDNYLQIVDTFANWVNNNHEDMNRIDLEEGKELIQPYLDDCIDRGLATNTIRTYRAGLCKAFGELVTDYEAPERNYTDTLKRQPEEAVNYEYNLEKGAVALELNEVVGLRRSELTDLRVEDIEFCTFEHSGEEYALVHSVGKGGRRNENIIMGENSLNILNRFIERSEGQESYNGYLLSEEEMNNNTHLHSARAEYAKNLYEMVLEDIAQGNTEAIEFYKNYAADHGMGNDIDGTYSTRGYNRQVLIEYNRPTDFNKLAVSFVSANIGHSRLDVTVQHYLTK